MWQVRIHVASVNSGLRAPAGAPRGPPRTCPLLIFDEVTRQEAALVVRQCTAVNPHALPLVAARLQTLAPADPLVQRQKNGRQRGIRRKSMRTFTGNDRLEDQDEDLLEELLASAGWCERCCQHAVDSQRKRTQC